MINSHSGRNHSLMCSLNLPNKGGLLNWGLLIMKIQGFNQYALRLGKTITLKLLSQRQEMVTNSQLTLLTTITKIRNKLTINLKSKTKPETSTWDMEGKSRTKNRSNKDVIVPWEVRIWIKFTKTRTWINWRNSTTWSIKSQGLPSTKRGVGH